MQRVDAQLCFNFVTDVVGVQHDATTATEIATNKRTSSTTKERNACSTTTTGYQCEFSFASNPDAARSASRSCSSSRTDGASSSETTTTLAVNDDG